MNPNPCMFDGELHDTYMPFFLEKWVCPFSMHIYVTVLLNLSAYVFICPSLSSTWHFTRFWSNL